MAVPFVAAEADHDTVTLLFPRVGLGFPGAVGLPAVAAEAVDAAEVPNPLVAVTVKL